MYILGLITLLCVFFFKSISFRVQQTWVNMFCLSDVYSFSSASVEISCSSSKRRNLLSSSDATDIILLMFPYGSSHVAPSVVIAVSRSSINHQDAS